MILIIGGLGFVGANTAQALLDLGEACILTQHRNSRVPAFLRDHVGKRIFIEPLDISDSEALLALGKKYTITGIVHLATGGMPVGPGASAFELIKDVQDDIDHHRCGGSSRPRVECQKGFIRQRTGCV